MSRNLTSVSSSVLSCFVLLSNLIAGVGSAQTSAPDGQSSRPISEDSKKARLELEKKATGLLNELIAESANFSLVENRIFLQAKAIELFWDHDEPRARALVQDLIALINAQQAAPRPPPAAIRGSALMEADNYISEQRGSLLNFLAKKDSKLALAFLRATRTPKPARDGAQTADDPEKYLELQLAAQVAENDPTTALQIAEEALKHGLDAQAIDIWSRLLNKDPQSAARLGDQLIDRLKANELMKDGDQFQLVLSMLRELKSRLDRKPEKATAGSTPPGQREMQQAIRELLELLVEATLKVTSANLINAQESDWARNLLTFAQSYTPEIEKFLPARAAAVKAKLAQFEKAIYASSSSFTSVAALENMLEKSTDELLEQAGKASEIERQTIIYLALSRAKTAAEADKVVKYANETLKMSLDPGVIDQLGARWARNAELPISNEEARKALDKLPSDEQRAQYLALWAAKAAATGDVKNAQVLFDETRRLIGDQMQTRAQLETQLALVRATLAFDVDKSFEIAQAAVERLNRLVAAGLEMAAFDGMAAGEMRLETSEAWSAYTGKFNETAVALADRDFDRTARLLKQWQPNEVRIMISLSVLQEILSEKK